MFFEIEYFLIIQTFYNMIRSLTPWKLISPLLQVIYYSFPLKLHVEHMVRIPAKKKQT